MPPPFQGKSSQTKLVVWGIWRKNTGGIQLQPSSLLMLSSVHSVWASSTQKCIPHLSHCRKFLLTTTLSWLPISWDTNNNENLWVGASDNRARSRFMGRLFNNKESRSQSSNLQHPQSLTANKNVWDIWGLGQMNKQTSDLDSNIHPDYKAAE